MTLPAERDYKAIRRCDSGLARVTNQEKILVKAIEVIGTQIDKLAELAITEGLLPSNRIRDLNLLATNITKIVQLQNEIQSYKREVVKRMSTQEIHYHLNKIEKDII